MRTIEGVISGAPDFELGRPRTEPLHYTADCPDGPAAGLAFLIPGFGEDTDKGYAAALRRHVVETHGMVAVSVRYHCIGARPATGARIEVDLRERLTLVGLAAAHGIGIDDPEDLLEIARRLAARGVAATVAGVLRPARGEYQNFGVMQALDHLAALGDIRARGLDFDTRRIVALGSSHGGYIAHLMARFAPRTFAMVIDNSSYTAPPMTYLGQAGAAELVVGLADGVLLTCGVESAWTTTDRLAANFYDRNRDLIRDTAYLPHLKAARAAAGDTATAFRMVNAAVDPISPPALKERQCEALRRAGFDARLFLVEEGELDGRLFKRLVHGLDASLAGLFDLAMAELEPRDGPIDADAGTEVTFDCIDSRYQLTHSLAAPGVKARVVPLTDESRESGGEAVAA